ncbi:hypothetical protein GCM10027423_42470 [Spirosoma arcticum]
MGQDKSRLVYHGKPQREYLTDLLQLHCETVFWSVNADQAAELFNSEQSCIVDAFEVPGPLNGILSAFQHDPAAAWLVVACDMPFLSDIDLVRLMWEEQSDSRIVAAYTGTDGLPDPLLSLWEPSAYPLLLAFLAKGGYSPRQFLIEHQRRVRLLKSGDSMTLLNANDWETMAESKRKIDLQNSYPPLTFYAAGSDPYDVSHPCPICGVGQPASPRYRHYVCGRCVDRAADEAGNRLLFYNYDMSGGLLVRRADTNETVDTTVCWIDGVRCFVQEGRFGGFVVQPGDDLTVS